MTTQPEKRAIAKEYTGLLEKHFNVKAKFRLNDEIFGMLKKRDDVILYHILDVTVREELSKHMKAAAKNGLLRPSVRVTIKEMADELAISKNHMFCPQSSTEAFFERYKSCFNAPQLKRFRQVEKATRARVLAYISEGELDCLRDVK